MNHINLFLIKPRVYMGLMTLMLLLQRTPIIRHLVTVEKNAINPAIRVMQKAVLAVASFGAVHSVTAVTSFKLGQTDISGPQNFTFDVDENVVLSFTITGTPAVIDHWDIGGLNGDLLGLVVDNGNNTVPDSGGGITAPIIFISGTAARPGTFILTLKPFSSANKTTGALQVTITVEGEVEPDIELTDPVVDFQSQADSITLTWNVLDGHDYELQSSTNLVEWNADSLAPSLSQGVATLEIPTTGVDVGTMYRIEATLTP